MSRIVMFVYGDVRYDARVWREARALRDDGHTVELVTRAHPGSATTGSVRREIVDRIVVWSIVSSSLRYRLAPLLRSPRQALGELRDGIRRIRKEGRSELAASGIVYAGGLVAVPYFGWRWLRFRVGHPARPRRPRTIGLASWTYRWYDITRIWARGALDVIGPADAWHGHDLTGVLAAAVAARRFGGKLVYDNHELYLESAGNAIQPRWARRLAARAERTVYRSADAVIAVNRSIGSELGKRYGDREITVVRNVWDRWEPPRVRPRRLHEALGLDDHDPIALYHGYLGAHRGMEQLAGALLCPGMERVHAVLLGMGTYEPFVRAWAADRTYGGRLHFLPAVSREGLLSWVASADVAVMAIQPSTTNHLSSSPNKLFEAMAAGTPIVASDFPEMRSIVDDPDGAMGLLVDPTDPGAIADAVVRIVDDPVLAATFRANALAAAERRWNWQVESEALTTLYRRLLGVDPRP